jgi:hypothetical protein
VTRAPPSQEIPKIALKADRVVLVDDITTVAERGTTLVYTSGVRPRG